MTHKSKWLLLAPAGLLAVGTGACLVAWAATLKNRGTTSSRWVPAGTLALGVLNAGLSLFGRSVVEKTLYELREKPFDLRSESAFSAISQF